MIFTTRGVLYPCHFCLFCFFWFEPSRYLSDFLLLNFILVFCQRAFLYSYIYETPLVENRRSTSGTLEYERMIMSHIGNFISTVDMIIAEAPFQACEKRVGAV